MKLEFRNELSLKSKFSLILFVYNLMIRYSKRIEKIIHENAFVKKKKKPKLKFIPRFVLWLSTNWAKLPVTISLLWRLWYNFILERFFLVYPFSIHLINLNFRLIKSQYYYHYYNINWRLQCMLWLLYLSQLNSFFYYQTAG